jgi:alkylated DNA nucleotide flippase Atl1
MVTRNGTSPLFGPRVNYTSTEAQRQNLLAQRLLGEGINLSPVQSGWEGLARIGTAGIGGYLQNQAGETENAYKAERAKTLAEALAAGQGTPAAPPPTMAGGEAAATRGTGVAPQATPGDPQRMAAILMGNPQTADMGAQLALGQMQFAQNRAAQKEDTAASQAFQKELANIQQQFLTGQLNSQQAHAAQLAAQQRAHAAGLQTGQQQFLTQQQTAAALSKVPQGYQVSTQGGIAPIPGSPQATEAADLAKSKGESVVSVDRMIRSIDELNTHPGLEGTVGFSVGQRYIPGTDAASFDARLETLKSQAFLPMVAQLKGMGQLSDAEGKKLTAAIGALEPRMSEKEFRASLAEIKSDLIAARKRMGAPEKSTVETPSKPMGNLPALPGGFVIMDK